MRRAGLFIIALLALALVMTTGAAEELATLTRVMRYREAKALSARVAEALGSSGTLRVDERRNALTVSDEPARMAEVQELLQMLDVPARHFALEVEFGVFESPKTAGILREFDAIPDSTPWLTGGKLASNTLAVLNMAEGGRVESAVLPGVSLRASVEGYDPTRRKLGFSELSLIRKPGDLFILSGRASLPEGEATIFFLAPQDDPARFRLSLRPLLLPRLEEREIP